MPALLPPDPPPTDGVITLRPYRDEDADDVVAALQDAEIVRWTRVPADYSHAAFRAFRELAAANAARGEGLSLAVAGADDRVVGSVGIHSMDSGRPDLGYWIARHARGRGLAPRAARLMAGWALTGLGLDAIEILVHRDNAPSLRVAAKAGFTRTGELRACPRAEGQVPLVVFVSRRRGVPSSATMDS